MSYFAIDTDELAASETDAERRAERRAFLEHERRSVIAALGHRRITQAAAEATVAGIDAELAELSSTPRGEAR